MARKHYRIGVMFSTTGSYSVVARSMLNGALLAFQEIADAGARRRWSRWWSTVGRSRVTARSVWNCLARHPPVGRLLYVVEPEVIPCFEKFDGLLWYPSL